LFRPGAVDRRGPGFFTFSWPAPVISEPFKETNVRNPIYNPIPRAVRDVIFRPPPPMPSLCPHLADLDRIAKRTWPTLPRFPGLTEVIDIQKVVYK
jgi:hypothetical protein